MDFIINMINDYIKPLRLEKNPSIMLINVANRV